MYQLRELQQKDIAEINKWRNDFLQDSFLEEQVPIINNLLVGRKKIDYSIMISENAIRCVIVYENKDEILGLVSLESINYINLSAKIDIMIGDKKNKGQEIGTYAINAMLYHAFCNMNLRRVEFSVYEDNLQARFLAEKCGFRFEGRKRKLRSINGVFIDLLVYGILKEEFGIKNSKEAKYKLPCWCISTITMPDEIDSVIKVCDKAFVSPIAERENYRELLMKIHRKGHVLIAHTKEVLGYCAIYTNDCEKSTAYITLICVKPEAQHFHIGRGLLNKSLMFAKCYGMSSCVLEVKKTNSSAIKFYKSNGFYMISENERSFFMKKIL